MEDSTSRDPFLGAAPYFGVQGKNPDPPDLPSLPPPQRLHSPRMLEHMSMPLPQHSPRPLPLHVSSPLTQHPQMPQYWQQPQHPPMAQQHWQGQHPPMAQEHWQGHHPIPQEHWQGHHPMPQQPLLHPMAQQLWQHPTMPQEHWQQPLLHPMAHQHWQLPQSMPQQQWQQPLPQQILQLPQHPPPLSPPQIQHLPPLSQQQIQHPPSQPPPPQIVATPLFKDSCDSSSPTMLLGSTRKRPHVMHNDIDPAPPLMRVSDSETEDLKRKKLKPDPEPTDHLVGSSGRSSGGLAGGRWTSHAAVTKDTRPLPFRCPPYPWGGSKRAIRQWNQECRRISRLAANDPNTYPPILRNLKGLNTADESSKENNMLLRAAEFVVSISSIGNDGEPVVETGIIINACDSSVRILTCSLTVCDDEGKLFDSKPLVHLADKTIHEGKLLFVDDLYRIALLEILIDKPLRAASLSPAMIHGSKVFLLARHEGHLTSATGKVLRADKSWLDCNCYVYLSCKIPWHGTGGPVLDEEGSVLGMSFELGTSNGAVLPSSVIMKCIEMQKNFSRIARPMHGLSLRTVEHLDLRLRDEIFYEHNISTGYFVEKVSIDSNAEALGIRKGDLIVSFDGLNSHTIVELEEHLLSLGSEFLAMKMSSDSEVVLELHVYAPLEKRMRYIKLPVGFARRRSMCMSPD